MASNEDVTNRPKTYSRTFKAALLASGGFLTASAGLVSMAVLARVLTMHDYATYRQTMLAYTFAAPLLTLGLPQALYYFLPGEKRRARALLLENLLLLGLMGGVFSLFLLLGGNRLLALRFSNPALTKTLVLLTPYPLFMLPASALSACLMARDRVKQVAFFNTLSRFLMLVLVISACLIWRTPTAALIGTVLGAGIVLFPALKLMLDSCRSTDSRPTSKGMWAQMKYGVPLGLAVMIASMSMGLDKVVVASLCTATAFAVYVNGAIEVPLITIVTGSVTSVLIPEFAILYRAGQPEQILTLWRRATVKCAIIILPAMLFLLFMAPEVIRLVFSPKYSKSAEVFRIYLLILPLRITNFAAIFMASNKNRLLVIRSLGTLLLNALLTVFLVWKIGYLGACIATVISMYLFMLPYSMCYMSKFLDISVRRIIPLAALGRILLAVVIPCVVFLLPSSARPKSDLTDVALMASLYSAGLLCVMQWMRIVDARPILKRLARTIGLH